MKRYVFAHTLNNHITITIFASSMDTAMNLLLYVVRDINNFEIFKVVEIH